MRTVRVRIAVAVDAEGKWAASGWKDGGDKCKDFIADDLGDPYRIVWVEADVPLPAETTVKGEVVE